MEDLENYFETFKRLVQKTKSEKLVVYRIHDCGLHGDSYLILIPQKETKNIRNYLQEIYLDKQVDNMLKELIKEVDSTIQVFKEPLERENLNLENLTKLISSGFVQVRTNKIDLKNK